jgi:hypothetical protein
VLAPEVAARHPVQQKRDRALRSSTHAAFPAATSVTPSRSVASTGMSNSRDVAELGPCEESASGLLFEDF